MPADYQLWPMSDHAFTIQWGQEIDDQVNERCHASAAFISKANLQGIVDIIPAYTTVTIVYDPILVWQHQPDHSAADYVCMQLRKVLNDFATSASMSARRMIIPACFDPAVAPDLHDLAASHGMDIPEVIRIFTAQSYKVYMIGFLPGFPYMGTVPAPIATPRRDTPHTNVAAGSIGIAGKQTGIYPQQSPGGWNIIGRTKTRMFYAGADEPCYLRPGDEVIFEPIDLITFKQQSEHV